MGNPSINLPAIRLNPILTDAERAAWGKAKADNNPEAYDAYLEAFPNGPNAEEARQAIANFVGAKESAAWEEAKRSNTLSSYQNFVRQYPQSRFVKEAEDKIAELRDDAAWATAQATNTPAACQQYLNNYPTGRHADAARQCASPAPAKVDAPRPLTPAEAAESALNDKEWAKLSPCVIDPNSNEVTIPFRLTLAGDAQICVYNTLKKEMVKHDFPPMPAGKYEKKLYLNQLNPGRYLVVVRSAGKALMFYQFVR